MTDEDSLEYSPYAKKKISKPKLKRKMKT